MAEAAAAIRQPKKPASQRDTMDDDQLLARSSEVDELQRITKFSESGGVEANRANGESPAFATTEIQSEEGNPQIESWVSPLLDPVISPLSKLKM